MPVTYSYSENTQTLQGRTTADNANTASPSYTPLNDQVGAPWEIFIESFVPDDTDWGEATYTNNTNTDMSGKINFNQAKEIAGSIHRILKHYLGAEYQVNNIEAVRLNVVIKTPAAAAVEQAEPGDSYTAI